MNTVVDDVGVAGTRAPYAALGTGRTLQPDPHLPPLGGAGLATDSFRIGPGGASMGS